MKRYDHIYQQKWLECKEKILREGLGDISTENSEIILRFLKDMELGVNTGKGSRKGGRSPRRLTDLKGRLIKVLLSLINMKITKLGHCCLLIEEKGLRILTDPGNYSTIDDELKNIDIILITHEHADHFHVPALKKLIENNPKVKVITNISVSELIEKEDIPVSFLVMKDGQKIDFGNLTLEAIEGKHELIYKTWKDVQNTGFFIDNKLFYPGDSFYNPRKKVDILALPVAGPWCRIVDAVNYALEIKPRVAFPVHDGALKVMGGNHKVPATVLPENGIEFRILEEDKETEL